MSGVPEAAAEKLWSMSNLRPLAWEDLDEGLREGYREEVEELALILRKAWEQELLGDEIVEAAERAYWGCIPGALEPHRFREAIRAAAEACREAN